MSGRASPTYGDWREREILALPGVRGFVVGRALLYPAGGDVASAVALVHAKTKAVI